MRTRLTEIEKFYIQRNHPGMKIEKFQEMMPDVDPQVVRAYVLNQSTPEVKESLKETHEIIRERKMKAGDFFDTSTNKKKENSGVVKLTPEASMISDANIKTENVYEKNINHITTMKG